MKNFKYTNNLIEETSPYLQSHAHQPINWYPWCDEALRKAQNENKLLFISIGYSACHWCHNMSIECFENETVALILNEHYVSIKIDKEERPDLDQIYLNAVQLMTDNAGWPLNCFAMPDGTPVFGGTYFTSSQFVDIIQSLQDTYYQQYNKVKEVADDLLEALQNVDVITEREPLERFTENDLRLIIEPWKRKFNNVNGGTQNPPKFPLPNGKEFLLQAAYYLDDNEIKRHLIITLNKMANGAIYDQVGGGFFRYAVDAEWKVPHFEKMLYDNTQLVSLYSKAYQFFKDEKYKQIATNTLTFLLREMHSSNGAFYCSVDSDSEHGEGRYYMWTLEELDNILGEDIDFAKDYYGLISACNPKDFNVLYVDAEDSELASKYALNIDELQQKINEIRQKLFNVRLKRKSPNIDKKIIASWNGMAIIALFDAYMAFNGKYYLELAKQTAKYIKDVLIYEDGHIYRCVTSKHPIKGFLDDYAFVIKAFILLFAATGEKQYIHDAKGLMNSVIKHFYDAQSGMFYYTSDEEKVPIGKKMDFIDRAVPSSGSEIAQDLMLLAYIYNDSEYYDYVWQMVANVKSQMAGAGPFISNWAQILFYYVYDPVIVKLSPENMKLMQLLRKEYNPNTIAFPILDEHVNDDSFSKQLTRFYFEIDDKWDSDDIEKLIKIAIDNKREKSVSI